MKSRDFITDFIKFATSTFRQFDGICNKIMLSFIARDVSMYLEKLRIVAL